MNRTKVSIYGRLEGERPDWGAREPIGMGHGGEGDYEYRSRDAARVMLGRECGILEVPPSLTKDQFLDIQTSYSD